MTKDFIFSPSFSFLAVLSTRDFPKNSRVMLPLEFQIEKFLFNVFCSWLLCKISKLLSCKKNWKKHLSEQHSWIDNQMVRAAWIIIARFFEKQKTFTLFFGSSFVLTILHPIFFFTNLSFFNPFYSTKYLIGNSIRFGIFNSVCLVTEVTDQFNSFIEHFLT